MATVTPLEPTMQRYFDETVNFLRKQAKRATAGTRNVYRSDDGNRCVIGRWIPDGHRALDKAVALPVRKLASEYPELHGVAWPGSAEGLDLANALQKLHDGDYRGESGGGLSAAGERQVERYARFAGLVYKAPAA